MLRCKWGALGSWLEFNYGLKDVIAIILLGQRKAPLKGYPCSWDCGSMAGMWFVRQTLTLIFPIASLNFLVFALLNLALQYTRTLGFIEPGNFENLRRVKPRVRAPAHHRYALAHPERENTFSLRVSPCHIPRTSRTQGFRCKLPRRYSRNAI